MSFVHVNAIIELRRDGDVSFQCPFCWSKYKKRNNEPVKNAVKKHHSISNLLKEYPDKVEKVDETKIIVYLDKKFIQCDSGRFPSEYAGFLVTT